MTVNRPRNLITEVQFIIRDLEALVDSAPLRSDYEEFGYDDTSRELRDAHTCILTALWHYKRGEAMLIRDEDKELGGFGEHGEDRLSDFVDDS